MQNVLIIGTGESGYHAALLLLEHNKRVYLYDDAKDSHTVKRIGDLCALGCSQLFDLQGLKQISIDTVVLSPSISARHPFVQYYRAQGVPVISELELSSHFYKGKILAVTGTNGKSTTCALLYEMLSQSKDVVLCGNYGNAFSSVATNPSEYAVVEASSYQLEFCSEFRPHIGAILNVAPDHLHRHRTMTEYILQKLKIFSAMRAEDFAVVNDDDDFLSTCRYATRANTVFFSSKRKVNGAYVKGTEVWFDQKPLFELHTSLIGKHNLQNVLCATTIAYLEGLSAEQICAAIKGFCGLKHRLQHVADINGAGVYNDSKATNIAATQVALSCFRSNVVLMLGGYDKGEDFFALFANGDYKRKIKHTVVFGAAAHRIAVDARRAGLPFTCCDTLEEAIDTAFARIERGDTLLFSPACSSYDSFRSFEERGDYFIRAVEEWKKRIL